MTRPGFRFAVALLLPPLLAVFGAVRAWEVAHPLESAVESAAHRHSGGDAPHFCALASAGAHHCIHASTIFVCGEIPIQPTVADAVGEIPRASSRDRQAEIRFASSRDPPSAG